MTPDVLVNFLANIFIAVGAAMCWPLKSPPKRIGLVVMVVAAVVNVIDSASSSYGGHVRPGELLLNCAMAYYFAVVVWGARPARRNGMPK